MDKVYAVIMAGGSGTRFWPASRNHRPKQLLGITGAAPMIRTTVDRILPGIPDERILVVTGAAHAKEIKEVLHDLPSGNILIEPVGRNTAPCIGLAAHAVMQKDPDGIMLVLPADHIINNLEEFKRLTQSAADLAASDNALVTLGVSPTYPETGYGYIEAGPKWSVNESAPSKIPAFKVHKFHEKPDREKADFYLRQGNYYWNSGMFIWKARTILTWFERLLPQMACDLAPLAGCRDRVEFSAKIEAIYPLLQSISIDYGIMEHADNVAVIPADIGWSDVGSWKVAAEHWPVKEGHSALGEVLSHNSKGCAVYSPDKPAALVGVEDLVIVDTPDALLICHKDQTQDVGKIVEKLKNQGRKDLI